MASPLLIDGMYGTSYASQAATDAASGNRKPASTYIEQHAQDRLDAETTRLAREAAARKAAAEAAAAQRINDEIADTMLKEVGDQTGMTEDAAEADAARAGGGGATSFFDLNEIRAALDAIQAIFDAERGSLQNQEQGLERALELLLSRLGRDREITLSENKARNAGSGRIRSGLFLRDQGKIVNTFADQIVRARSASDVQRSPIRHALATLSARRSAAQTEKAREIARAQRATQAEIARALELI